MQFLVEHSWGLFIGLEIAALVCIGAFIGTRYILSLPQRSNIFLFLFLSTMVLEGLLAFLVYKSTGEIETFQIVIIIFIIYAGTFGINDFKKLDYAARVKIGKWRNVTLVTDEEVEKMHRLNDPKVVARKARIWFYFHTIVFLGALIYFWNIDGSTEFSWTYFVQHREWFDDQTLPQPFTSEMIGQIFRLWLIIYVIDTIINWSYTFFPAKEK